MLLDFQGDVEEVFARTFVADYEEYGTMKTIELCPGGANRNVTEANRDQYVELYVKWLLEDSIQAQFSAFSEGFHEVCGGAALRMFIPEELELLICGSPSLDFLALEEVTSTEDGFTRDHPLIRAFWEIVHEMSLEDKKKLLFFCTGSDRSPIKGLGSMTFVISRNGPDSDRLPTAHTCFNHLLLPEYSDKEKLRVCLMTAINNSEGFGLM
uniref:HECT-type E3 ubiquitin transferase n=2 Tax=Hemiselmis tepida TaxID=464990 RepID=A0A7S0W7Q4_9CRYP|mmetsp:Transcript_38555/g.98557  ORF Transcript_38555/g.98557 Transcript_38555/m.98557 type:complete len:211 (+) Transcript_38555:392-1024(+)